MCMLWDNVINFCVGFLTTEEMDLYQKTARDIDSNWWIPFQWGYTLIGRAFKEGKLTEGGMMRLHDVRLSMGYLCVLYCQLL